MTSRDFNDSAVRAMVENNHRPRECYKTNNVTLERYLASIRCELDNEHWPCRAVQDLKAWRDAVQKATPIDFTK